MYIAGGVDVMCIGFQGGLCGTVRHAPGGAGAIEQHVAATGEPGQCGRVVEVHGRPLQPSIRPLLMQPRQATRAGVRVTPAQAQVVQAQAQQGLRAGQADVTTGTQHPDQHGWACAFRRQPPAR